MKNRFRSFYIGALAVAGLGLIGTSFVPRAKADVWDKMTVVTVNERIIAGNKVLEPGTYVWKLLDSPSDRHVVQIFDKDQRHLEETILAIPNERLEPQEKASLRFGKRPQAYLKPCALGFIPATTSDRSSRTRKS